MMDPESAARPAGWLVDRNGLAHPDPQASANRERLDRREAQIVHRLKAHVEFAAAVQGLEERFAEEIRMLRNASTPPGAQSLALIADLNPAVQEVARTIGTDVGLTIDRLRFIFRRLFPGLADDHPLMRMQPAQLVANVSGEPRMLNLDPGEIVMVFTDAEAGDREAYNDLILAMQKSLGYPVGKGGRRPGARNEELACRAEIAAKLHRWLGWRYDQIAALFGWSEKDDHRRQEDVRRLLRQGETSLAEALGPNWEEEPPQDLGSEKKGS